MRRKILFLGMATLAAMCFLYSCSEDENIKATEKPAFNLKSEAIARVITIPDESGHKSSEFMSAMGIVVYVGHTAKDCNNSCRTTNGVTYHADCYGSGTACPTSSTLVPYNPDQGLMPVTLKSTMKSTATFMLIEYYENSITTDETFWFPARSCKVIDADNPDLDLWLNIPDQILERNPETNTFIFNDVYYTDTPDFINE